MRSTEPLNIAIFTRHDDFHAHVFRHALEARGVRCSVVLNDTLAGVGGMSWSMDEVGTVSDLDGQPVAVEDIHAIWWRRATGEPRIPPLRDESARDLVINDCRATLLGMLLTRFRGRWISHPEVTRLAQNKLLQLSIAKQVGLAVPRTLVSQDPEQVRQFCEELEYAVVVKTVAGAPNNPVMAGMITPDMIVDEQAVRLCPAIYQEFVPGERHLRICCFGERVYTAVLQTDQLDWRYPLEAEVMPFELEAKTAKQVRTVIKRLGLRMGIVDMKLTPEGVPVWLEVNPQGQFLFLEGMCGSIPLTRLFADFLEAEAAAASTRAEPTEMSPIPHYLSASPKQWS